MSFYEGLQYVADYFLAKSNCQATSTPDQEIIWHRTLHKTIICHYHTFLYR